MKCKFIKPDKNQCGAFAQANKAYCFRHDPKQKEAGLLASIKGGEKRILKGVYGDYIRLKTPQDAKDFIAEVIEKIWKGEIPVPVGGSMGFLVRVWLDCHEASEVEDKISQLEERLNKAKL